MSTSWLAVHVLCPFYKNDEKTRIRCEGVTEDSALVLCFSTAAGKEQQKCIFCDDNFRSCEVFRMVMDARYSE